ncbi:GntR family transcriptional regulator [Peterkaempfera bronchialis]|uniref:GntR family transcriptional regulator n=1 Tax=Peterkaempfera bronchialis TaxID=2126346 RepID=UPI003C2C97AA
MAEQLQRDAVLVHQRLRDQVAQALRAALIAGELRPGVVYSAPGLASQYGVSATPVREAMLDLTREGLVEAVRNKGFRVTEMTARDLDEFTEVRTLIEVPTVGRVATAATAKQLEALRPAALETVAAAHAHDVLRYLEADRRFHLDLLSLAGNTHLVEVVGDLRRRSRLYGLDHPDHPDRTGRTDRTGRLVASAEEHLELLDLLLAGDREGAEQCMLRHLSLARSLRADDRPATPPTPALRLGWR